MNKKANIVVNEVTSSARPKDGAIYGKCRNILYVAHGA